EDGRCIGAMTKLVTGSGDVALAETTGLFEALQWATNIKDMEVIVEMDAAVVVRAIQTRRFPKKKHHFIFEFFCSLARSFGPSLTAISCPLGSVP
ncbi:hypothetical protein A2U01_0050041, partial [Trifolium medium]|nr:hypothetical protein [Trifolium medium]